jgi:hypothetical protein
MSKKCPSTINFLFLLGFLTFLYAMFMNPLAKGSFQAFKENKFQEYSDGLIKNVKSRIDSLIGLK